MISSIKCVFPLLCFFVTIASFAQQVSNIKGLNGLKLKCDTMKVVDKNVKELRGNAVAIISNDSLKITAPKINVFTKEKLIRAESKGREKAIISIRGKSLSGNQIEYDIAQKKYSIQN